MADRKGLSAWQWSCRGVSISISSYVFPANKMNTFTARVLVICPFSEFITIRQARKVNVCEHQFIFCFHIVSMLYRTFETITFIFNICEHRFFSVFILCLCCIVLSKLDKVYPFYFQNTDVSIRLRYLRIHITRYFLFILSYSLSHFLHFTMLQILFREIFFHFILFFIYYYLLKGEIYVYLIYVSVYFFIALPPSPLPFLNPLPLSLPTFPWKA